MSIDIIVLTTGKRTELLRQTILSLQNNADQWDDHTLTLVVDGNGIHCDVPMPIRYTSIFCASRPGASASRNIGAGSIPRYRRGSHVLFLDDDVYMCLGWDEKMLGLAESAERLTPLGTIETFHGCIVSGYGHPFNQAEMMQIYDYHDTAWPRRVIFYSRPLVISSVCMMMPWEIFDAVGPWDEPGGPGGSEDYALCQRAGKLGYGFAVTDPQVCIHTGLTSSTGKEIVGHKELLAQNERLLTLYNLKGKVVMG